ncbi:hypothetical protein [Ruminiclostridium papyrosolvens]|uniref:HNH endonuclease n=1 Tax=Ruminiclostridium papyrosolvens C7 TaxID=1330534 RepID=U4R3S9_9FIRM|nr:hypothetical protein [Ruminiclostridium papyrosolvens]EPR12488.1 hypothetical protein L323_08010 [Ruminiclostridium papyrosolvens C7]
MAQEFSKAFYNSKEWKKCRKSYIKTVKGLCETCLSKGTIKTGYIVHHTIKLTPDNINNPDITLNHELLRYDCLECHNTDELGEHNGKQGVLPLYKFDEDGQLIPISPP